MTEHSYRNLKRIEDEEKELEELEAAYRKEVSGEVVQPVEEDTPEQVLQKKEDETWKQRYSNLRSYADKQRNELQEEMNSLKTQLAELNKKTPMAMPSNTEEALQWVQKYPDLAAVIKALIREDVDFLKEELGPKVVELEKLNKENSAQIAYQKAWARVLEVHSDFPVLINSQEFVDWVEAQPEEKGSIGVAIKKALTEGFDADSAIKAVNIYKQEKQLTKRKSSPARDAALTVRTPSASVPDTVNGKKIFRESEIERMSVRDYERLEDEIDLAKREGRIDYDITGAAR